MADRIDVQREAARLVAMPRAQARREFSGIVGRAFQLTGAGFADALEFNAHLASELRELAQAERIPLIWSL